MWPIAGAPDRPLVIGGIEIPCYVLEDETRVLSQRGMFSSMGYSGGGAVDEMPRIVASKTIRPYINNDLMLRMKSPVVFKNPAGGGEVYGLPAEIIVDMCEAILKARDDGALSSRYDRIAQRCDILLRSFAKIGIIALIDEATGYQEIRRKRALAKIIETYIAEDLQAWKKIPRWIL